MTNKEILIEIFNRGAKLYLSKKIVSLQELNDKHNCPFIVVPRNGNEYAKYFYTLEEGVDYFLVLTNGSL